MCAFFMLNVALLGCSDGGSTVEAARENVLALSSATMRLWDVSIDATPRSFVCEYVPATPCPAGFRLFDNTARQEDVQSCVLVSAVRRSFVDARSYCPSAAIGGTLLSSQHGDVASSDLVSFVRRIAAAIGVSNVTLANGTWTNAEYALDPYDDSHVERRWRWADTAYWALPQ
jgi:hypothetical protein